MKGKIDMKKSLLVFLILIISSCSIIPKKVEFFQDKVEKMPIVTESHKEVQKEAAEYVARKTDETVQAAIIEDSSTNVLKPAVEAAVVAGSLSGSLGKPISPWSKEAEVLAAKLDKLDAKLDAKLEAFRKENDQNIGKKIEGSGVFQIGYFPFLALIGCLLVVLWMGLKMVSLLSPEVSIGTRILGGGIRGVFSLAKKGFSEVVEGGEAFKKKVDIAFADPATREKIKELFTQAQKEKQSRDVQEAIQKLTN